MNKENLIICIVVIIIGIIVGGLLANKQIKIEKLTKEKEKLQQEITEYQWQIAQVPYVIESWCKGE